MKIAHIVTYVSADGAFGGPVAVALSQTEELARRGHEVELLAGWDGKAALPASSVRHRLYRVRRVGPGFSGLLAPGMIFWLRRHAREYDVVHVHLARDLITLIAARIALAMGCRLIVQPHGMIMPDSRLTARLIDALATRGVLRKSATVFALTDRDSAGLAEVAGENFLARELIPNGIAVPAETPAIEREDPPVVMFLARLHARKRVIAFAQAAHLLIRNGTPATFEIFGPDEGDLAGLRNYITKHDLGQRIVYRGTVPQGGARDELRRASVYVLPAVREVFPMTVLEAMSVGTPVVLGQDCGIAPELARRGAASVSSDAPEAIAKSISQLLHDPELRGCQLAAADASLKDWLAIGAVANQLEAAYTGKQL